MTRAITRTLVVAALLAGCATTDDRAQGPPYRDRRVGFTDYGCPELARQVESASRGDYLEVRQVDALTVVQDHRASYSPPQGSGRVLVLRCTGSAQWSWGREPVMLEVSVDQHRDTRVTWEPAFS